MEQLKLDTSYCNFEKDVLEYWKNIELYRHLQKMEESYKDTFRFLDGPPFVSGQLHIAHVMISFLKSTILNFQRMHEMKCDNKLGYDCHGLPIESVVCKKLGVGTKREIEEMGIAKFNDVCKKTIKEYSGTWKPIFESIGRWADFDNVYKTMDVNFMESVWWTFKTLYTRNLVYRSYRVMSYSYGCQTPLSNFESGLNYKELTTKSTYVFFPIKNNPKRGFIVWTTTPWTLPYNVAICVNPDAEYVLCCENGYEYIIGKKSIKNFKYDEIHPFGIGKDLIGIEYEPPFDFVVKYNKVIADNYVLDTDDIGTCIVHIAPSFGEDDFRVCMEQKIIENDMLFKLDIIDDEGKNSNGILVFDTNDTIIEDLTNRKLLIKIQKYIHSYPYCYRTDTPLIYKLVSSYFINVTKIKDEMIELNKKINWYPTHIGEKRFNNWLEGIKDWGISRMRYFGTPIPIWISEDGTEMEVIGSVEELEKITNTKISDLHRENIDFLEIKKNGKILHRINDVFDCWFESGSAPIASIHYPFENTHYFDDKEYLCDFISEGLDQTRGWFYTLLVISTAIFHKPAFKDVICTGLILDSCGVKISKKLGNYVDVEKLIKEYGADALRLYLIGSHLIKADSLLFNEDDIIKIKSKMIQYMNCVKFFIEHAINFTKGNVDSKIKYLENYTGNNLMDKWILEELSNFRLAVEKNMKSYKIDKIVDDILEFIENLTNWYVKLNRNRIKNGYVSIYVLYTVLIDFTKITAPFMPFLSEYVFKCIGNTTSVHMTLYPKNVCNYGVMKDFKKLQLIAKMIRTLRDENKSHTSIRIPIKKCTIYCNTNLYYLMDIIKEEVNCIDFDIKESYISYKYEVKCNSRVIGKRFRKDSIKIMEEIEKFDSEQLKQIYNDKKVQIKFGLETYTLNVGEELNILMFSDVKLNKYEKCIVQNDIVVIADMTYDEETQNLYQTRLLIRTIQDIRKKLDLHPWNKILVHYNVPENLIKYMPIIKEKIDNDMIFDIESNSYLFEWKTLNGEIILIHLSIEVLN